MIAIGVRMEGAFFPVRVLKKSGILAAGKSDLAHDNSLAKAWSYTQRRLTHHLVLFVFVFSVRTRRLLAPTGHSFGDIDMKICWRIALLVGMSL